MKEHRKKNPVSARPTENGKEIKGKTELIQTMIRIDLMPIPILNKYKSEEGTHTHTQRDLKEHPHKSYNQPYHSKYKR